MKKIELKTTMDSEVLVSQTKILKLIIKNNIYLQHNVANI